MLLTRNSVCPVRQSPKVQPVLGSVLISLFLLTPNKVDHGASHSDNFPLSHFCSLSYKSSLPPAPLSVLQMETICFTNRSFISPICVLSLIFNTTKLIDVELTMNVFYVPYSVEYCYLSLQYSPLIK